MLEAKERLYLDAHTYKEIKTENLEYFCERESVMNQLKLMLQYFNKKSTSLPKTNFGRHHLFSKKTIF